VSDTPADVLLDYVPRAAIDLVVLGTHGRRAINRLLLGSVGERLIRLSPCPVLTVNHPERDCLLPQTVLADVEAHHL
jgi:nucleotide-binding universal stress UspA family protein